jgi:hypothetical protein
MALTPAGDYCEEQSNSVTPDRLGRPKFTRL